MIHACYFADIWKMTCSPTTSPTMLTYGPPPIEWKPEDRKKAITDKLKNSPNDSFGFIITTFQEAQWNIFVHELGLEKYISYQMPYWLTNQNHPSLGRRLKLIVLQHPAHPQRQNH